MSTLAPVIRPTSECQLGNGSRKNSPMMKAAISPTHGMPLLLTRPKICGMYRFRADLHDRDLAGQLRPGQEPVLPADLQEPGLPEDLRDGPVPGQAVGDPRGPGPVG